MYSVIYIDFDKNSFFKVYLFRSALEKDCWDFVQRRLTHSSEHIRKKAINLHVINTADEYCDQPAEILAMRKYLKEAS